MERIPVDFSNVKKRSSEKYQVEMQTRWETLISDLAMCSSWNKSSIPYSVNIWKNIFCIFLPFWPSTNSVKIAEYHKKLHFLCVSNMGFRYSKLESLDAGQCKKGISASSYRRAEKTSKNCSNARISNTWLMGVVFGRFLSSVVTYNSNSFFAVTSIKRHKFRVPTTHIGNTKIFPLFGLFCNFDQICGGSKRQKNLFPSVCTCYKAPIPNWAKC